MLRRFYNSITLEDNTLVELSQIWDYLPPTHTEPEEWEIENTYFRINGALVSGEEVSRTITIEEFEKLIDSAREDPSWSSPRCDEEHLL